jgi:hypothetical protein
MADQSWQQSEQRGSVGELETDKVNLEVTTEYSDMLT